MATKNFNSMETKKLNALMATVNDDDKAVIAEILAAREQSENEELTPEEKAAIEAAENNGGKNPMYKKSNKMTDEDRHALAQELKANMYHKCQVVPFNSIEWVNGFIAGIIEDKRSGKVLYAIKTDEGKRIVKVSDSKLIKILDESIEIERKARAGRMKRVRKEFTPEEIAVNIENATANVGKTIEYEKYRTVDENGEEHIEMAQGRIMAIMHDKRTGHVYYKVQVSTPTGEDPNSTRLVHKLADATNLVISEKFDQKGEEINIKYRERQNNKGRKPADPQGRVIRCEENLKKAEIRYNKAVEELELKKKQLETAKAELEAYLAAQANEMESLA